MLIIDYSIFTEEERATAWDWCPVDRDKKAIPSAMSFFSDAKPCDSAKLLEELGEAVRACPKSDELSRVALIALETRIRSMHIMGRARERLRNALLSALDASVAADDISKFVAEVLAENTTSRRLPVDENSC